MGHLLDMLKRESGIASPAIPAIPAILSGFGIEESQNRKNRSGHEPENVIPAPVVAAIRSRLLTLADDELLPRELVQFLPDKDVMACAPFTAPELRGYLHALEARQRMDAGLAPLEWGQPVAHACPSCGPVLVWQDYPTNARHCPWCCRHKAGKPIARPRESLVARWAQEDAENTSGPPYFLPKERGQ